MDTFTIWWTKVFGPLKTKEQVISHKGFKMRQHLTENMRCPLCAEQMRALCRRFGALLPEITMKFSMAVLLTVLGTVPLAAQRMPPGYLNEMPDPARVLATFGGSDSFDRTARQLGALHQLKNMVEDLSDGRIYTNQLTADEKRIIGRYLAASSRVEIPHFSDDVESRRWWDLKTHYEVDKAFRNELLDRFFSPAWKSNYLAIVAPNEKKVAARQQAAAAQQQAAAQQKSETARWEAAAAEVRETERNRLIVSLIIPLLLLALVLARETRPFGMDDSDPFTIRSGWKSYKVYSSTGTVLSPTKSRVVSTHVSGGGSQPVSTSTSTSIHDQFFIREANGFERALQLTNVDIALREGHQVSAVWGIRRGKESGSYFLFRNHSTRNVDFVDSVLGGMMRPHVWPVLPLIFTSLVVGFLHVDTWLSFLFLHPGATQTPQGLRGFYGELLLTAAATLVAVSMGFFIACAIVRNLRVRRLKRQMADKLLPILDQRATEQATTPSGARVTPS